MRFIKILLLCTVFLLCFSCKVHREAQTVYSETSISKASTDSVGEIHQTQLSTINFDENTVFEGIHIEFDTTDTVVATTLPYDIRAKPRSVTIDKVTKNSTLAKIDSVSDNRTIATSSSSDNIYNSTGEYATASDSHSAYPSYVGLLIFVVVVIGFLIWFRKRKSTA